MGLTSEIREALRAKPVSVNAGDSVRNAVEKMIEANSTAIIVKEGQEVIGVVTDADLLDSFKRSDNFAEAEIRSVMSPCDLITRDSGSYPCIQLDSGQSVKNGLALMHGAGIRHVMVTGTDDELLGVLSLVDLMKLAVH